MLRALDIRDILLIDHLELGFEAGLNVLTGETGAGKSILLDSLGFVLGWRGRAELVRSGAEQGEVTAVFDLPEGHTAFAVLEEAGIPSSGELILRRINTADGRKTAWVNDRRCSGDVLRALSEHLVELHGQNDDRGLLNPRGHRALLDDFAGLAPKLASLRELWRDKAAARKELKVAQKAIEDLRAEEEYLRHAVDELDKLAPEAGEDEALDRARRQMQAAEKVRSDIDRALSGLRDEKGAEDSAAQALRWLEGVGGEVGEMLGESVEALERGLHELALAADGVESTLRAMEFSPAELEACEERLFAIRGLARKYDVQPDDLAEHAEELRAKLEAIDASDAQLGALEAASAKAEAAYSAAAEALSEARKKAAAKLDKAVMAELAPLKMERAVFTTEVSDGEAGPEGSDVVSFVVATNPGAPSGPLAKIASGGELSRFLLALKVCLTGSASDVTMIFDEIDRGVGGATADAVGRRLRALGEGGQVLVVTHSPQVAALGQHHWRVEKNVKNGQTLSTVKPLGEAERVDEVARMISGDIITAEARAAAKALL
ncbi:DNA repair protein RecN [Lentibacter sp. XHP0401]|jgi:DNA repair protein RecN (Recombination protein N)|uniref:DNA repair protein RecN n=1 Tax=Lentibacter sp. XHP0401 TaxID=2984334 RepID=UPI0021E79F9D|nr:DNA repair protein RecN [Lentibacter sp. XHP0401]MCV2891644.1 DNA repair protein RecN [Lentibacter sp. XHP0401]